jgi:hypothetical protein
VKVEKSRLSFKQSSFMALVLILFLSACGDLKAEEPHKERQVYDSREVTAPIKLEKGKDKTVPIHPKQEEANALKTATLKKYFDESFEGTSWYALIKDMEVTGEKLMIQTIVLPDDNEGKRLLGYVRPEVWQFVNSKDSEIRLKSIVFFDQNGKLLFYETNPLNG